MIYNVININWIVKMACSKDVSFDNVELKG